MVKKTKNVQYFEAVGRRKLSVARVRLYLTGKDKSAMIGTQKIKEGEVYLNEKPLEKAVTIAYEREFMLQPLKLTGNENRFAVSIHVKGGGPTGQLEAIIHGLARALDLVDSTQYRASLKTAGFLTRDPRTRERRKVGTGGKARRVKQSPKR
jgi:small subunit ribosomal protein S9